MSNFNVDMTVLNDTILNKAYPCGNANEKRNIDMVISYMTKYETNMSECSWIYQIYIMNRSYLKESACAPQKNKSVYENLVFVSSFRLSFCIRIILGTFIFSNLFQFNVAFDD
jgi:hypothetical protein